MNSPIKYFGGKGMMQNKILQYIPDHLGYLEGCGGGASILFAKKQCKIEVYNDINLNVYSLFKVLADKELFDKFHYKCELTCYHENFRQEAKDKLKTELSLEERAFYYFYLNRTSVQGVGGFYQASFHSRQGINMAVNSFLSAIESLPEIHNRLRQVLICNRDVIELISKYDLKDLFLYLDPPYHHSTRTNARY